MLVFLAVICLLFLRFFQYRCDFKVGTTERGTARTVPRKSIQLVKKGEQACKMPPKLKEIKNI